MAIQQINLGNVVNDGLGDDLRTAFQKVNANFTELNILGTIQAINLTEFGERVFKRVYKTEEGANVLEFKTLIPAGNTRIRGEEDGLYDRIEISSIDPPSFKSISFDDSSVISADTQGEEISILGGVAPGATQPDIEVTSFGPNIFIKTLFPVTETLSVYDFGTSVGNPKSTVELLLRLSNIDFGTVEDSIDLSLDFGTATEPL
jgi:hypothetical protein